MQDKLCNLLQLRINGIMKPLRIINARLGKLAKALNQVDKKLEKKQEKDSEATRPHERLRQMG